MSTAVDPEAAGYQTRITVDFDGKGTGWRMDAVKTWHNLKREADEVEVHVSSGQHGLHFIAWYEADIAWHNEIAIRRCHGDDPRRVDMDLQRRRNGIFTGVLFEQKGHRDGKKERRFADVYDALDYIDAQRDDHERMNSLANDGHRGAPDLVRNWRAEP